MNEPSTMVATLGGQPQIITFTLDLLLERGETIDQVVVVYLASGPRYHEAYRNLVGEFASDQYAGRSCHLRSVPIRSGNTTLADARTPQEVEAVRATFLNLLADLKAQGQRVHLSLSGGRRVMALTALAAAMQHLTPADRIWHIYTPLELTEQAQDGAILHAPPDSGLHLIAVPFVPWAAYFPGLKPLLESSPRTLQDLIPVWPDEKERIRCQQLWQVLTPRRREVLHALAQGMTRPQVALHLGITTPTVDSHIKAIVKQAVHTWEGGDGTPINLAFLRARFGPYLASWDRV